MLGETGDLRRQRLRGDTIPDHQALFDRLQKFVIEQLFPQATTDNRVLRYEFDPIGRANVLQGNNFLVIRHFGDPRHKMRIFFERLTGHVFVQGIASSHHRGCCFLKWALRVGILPTSQVGNAVLQHNWTQRI
ncbi:MAG: hypothetical protein ABI476_01775 [Oxalobacteraceae bacterium]